MLKAEFERRRRALAEATRASESRRPLVTFPSNVRYLTGYTGGNGLLFVVGFRRGRTSSPILATGYRLPPKCCRIKVSTGPLLPDVVALIARKIRWLGLKNRLGYEQYEFLKSRLPVRCTLRPLADLVETQHGKVRDGDRTDPARGGRPIPEPSSRRCALSGQAALRADLAAEIDHRMRKLGAGRPLLKPSSLRASARPCLTLSQPKESWAKMNYY